MTTRRAPNLRVISGDQGHAAPPLPAAIALARALARRDAAAIIAGLANDSPANDSPNA